jgi:hypothetical protein
VRPARQAEIKSPVRGARLGYTGQMTIKRLDHISVVVDDLAAAKASFTALGMTVVGEAPI